MTTKPTGHAGHHGSGDPDPAHDPHPFPEATSAPVLGAQPTSAQPPEGTPRLLANRYRLVDLLADSSGARFWRATDTVLTRDVAVHILSSDDPRASALLDAARKSAALTDPHVLRVLDCDAESDLTWVVHEWGDGESLDIMLERGPLPASRAAWLTREVADAIAAGHAQELPHGWLNPEAVLVTRAGAVKLIGFQVEATLHDAPPPDPMYGDPSPLDADVINLAGILYASLTGHWPGVAPSAVPPAPRGSHRPFRPRQVRAGVPRTLDTICDRVLHKEATQHTMPIETAYEIAAALADHVGDPASMAPLELSQMYTEPTVSIPRLSAQDQALDAEAFAAPAPPAEPELPPYEESAERPLFASGERRVPEAAQAQQAAAAAAEATPGSTVTRTPESVTETGSGRFWPFGAPATAVEHATPVNGQGRGWLRTAAVIGVVIVLALIAAVLGTLAARESGDGGADPAPEGGAEPGLVSIANASDFDPYGTPPRENSAQADLAVDGNDATGWQTSNYPDPGDLGDRKPGVGLLLDLGAPSEVSEVSVALAGAPTSLEVYAAPADSTEAPRELDRMVKVGGFTDAGEQAEVSLASGTTTRYLVVWLTELPDAGPEEGTGFRGEIKEVAVRR